MTNQIRITVSDEIDSLLERVAKRLGKKKSMLARELMEQKMYDLEIIQKGLSTLTPDLIKMNPSIKVVKEFKTEANNQILKHINDKGIDINNHSLVQNELDKMISSYRSQISKNF